MLCDSAGNRHIDDRFWSDMSLSRNMLALVALLAFPFLGQRAYEAAEYWQIVLGPMFLLIVLFARGGIAGLLGSDRRG